jgi:predicted RNA-binding protein with PUA-like domain
MSAKPQFWIVKQEPTAYSWENFVRDGGTAWTGVRNPQARMNLRTMRPGDFVFFYHSVVGKEVVGLAKVTRDAYPDPTAPDWVCVDLVPVRPLKKRVSLETIKANARLRSIALVRQSRLSVIPLQAAEFDEIMRLGETKPPKSRATKPRAST